MIQKILLSASLIWSGLVIAQPLKVPAFTAYIEPNPNGASVSAKDGVTRWHDPEQHVVWFGKIATPGELKLSLSIKLPNDQTSNLKMTAAGKSFDLAVKGTGELQTIDVGTVTIASAGYQKFELIGVNKSGKTFPDIEALLLDGPARKDAHFNLVPRRNSASVHLGYPIPKDAQVEAFYNELTVRTEPLWSYYMACGFSRGYFGIQVNSPTERRIIFSVWDSGGEPIDRAKVKPEDRVQLLDKGEGVVAHDFGNEGTGGHSHMIYPWKKDQAYKFLVTSKVEGAHTTYTGYFFFPEKNAWGLIASFKAPKDGKHLRGLYSFNENFIGSNGQLRRLAEFANQWIRTTDGKWQELLTARFSHDPTGKNDRHDYGAGLIDGRFYLSNGGFVADDIKYGQEFKRPGGAKPPQVP